MIMAQHLLWKALAPLCARRQVNDGRCVPVVEAKKGEKMWEELMDNVEVFPTVSPSREPSSRPYKLPALRAMRNMKYGEELSPDYGINDKLI